MRKVHKNKKRCCKMCKAHKRGWENRWKPKEFAQLRRFEKERLWVWPARNIDE